MRGEILSFDDTSGTGVISGNDGQRYAFSRSAFQLPTAPGTGQRVDFEASNGEAVDILVVGPSAAATGDDRYASQNYGGAGAGANIGYAPTPTDVTAGFDWQKTFLSFNGRIRRSHFWIAFGIAFAAYLLLTWIPVIGFLIWLALLWPYMAIQVTRLHDMGKTGWLAIAPWVFNIVGIIALVSAFGVAAFSNPDNFDADNAAPAVVMGIGLGVIVLGLLNLAFLLWIGISDSQPGPNKYGPNPKDPLAGTADTFA